ncbi:MAG: monovalent cation/H(+) antiporter subunit G [Clostridia bacterium]
MTFFGEILILIGSIICFLGSIGIIRFPDAYTKLHAGTKCLSAGGTLIFLGIMLSYININVVPKVLLLILFFYFSNPLATQALARACYLRRIGSINTVVDEYQGYIYYNKENENGTD